MYFPFFHLWCNLKEIENMFSMFLSSYRNTRERLEELQKAVETFLQTFLQTISQFQIMEDLPVSLFTSLNA